ncbi:TadE/TadG family type IV pilus assembly protein [Hoeflea marina]|nr:TadE/TadG family type IV pilus assembly protein [Hoeflea marina]
MTRMRGAIDRLRRDRSGVGAVEFALIAPVLIVLYIGSLEISVAMSVNKKVARAASSIADLVTQNTDVNKTMLKTMVDVAQSIITPFQVNGLKIRISGIKIDSTGKETIAWSWDEKNTRPYAVGSVTTVPTDLDVKNTFLVRTEVSLQHSLLLVTPNIQDVDVKTLTMSKTYHLRQRIGDEVACSDC